MKKVFVDTSGFYALLDGTDLFHAQARDCFSKAKSEGWNLVTTNYVVHESWALIQRRLGWEALEAFLLDILPLCEIAWVDESLHAAGASSCRQSRQRRFSLTDAVSLQYMRQHGVTTAIVQDEHFSSSGISLP
ncbi:MAG TPA: PIN domain-containing protein [Candidatus Acidoferrum sp.]|nr:PIN domain-containing protein [Candidatus Acidoferrum sp.]